MAEKNKSQPIHSSYHRHHHRRYHRPKFWRWFWSIIGIIVVAALLVVAVMYRNLHSATNNMYRPLANTESNELDNMLKQRKPINILLLGIDTGAMNRHWKGRTDTIMMMGINPKTQTTTLMSIPRDMKATLPDFKSYSPIKINSAYTLGGVGETIKTLDKYYRIPINGYLLVNMGGLEKGIDQVGGINVTSPLTFDNMGYHFEKGKTYHCNGKKALAFAQLRHGDPRQDYGRQDRDRRVVMGLLKKSISPSTLLNNNFLSSISDEMQTNLTLNQMAKIDLHYRQATHNLVPDHAQGVSKMTDNVKFGPMEIEVIGQPERQRVSNKMRTALGLNQVRVAKLDDER